ncbi:MAG: CPBP family intramembrane glutamic endopeptidase [Chthoniobacterales bacterium]
MKSFIKQHRIATFFVLAYLLSWYPWILALLRGQTSGPNPLGPLVAGIIITAIAYGRTGLREFFSRMVRWRVGLHWYAVVLLLPPLLCLIGAALTLSLTNHSRIPFPSSDQLRELPDRFIFILLFIGLGEEPGWRGFALPQLQVKHSPMKASLILAPLWAIWHLPLMGNEFPWPVVPAFLLSVLGGTFMLTWLFNGTGGSVLLAMLFHATINTVGAGLIFPLFSDSALVLLWWIYGIIWLCAGCGALLLSARRKLPAIDAPTVAVVV